MSTEAPEEFISLSSCSLTLTFVFTLPDVPPAYELRSSSSSSPFFLFHFTVTVLIHSGSFLELLIAVQL